MELLDQIISALNSYLTPVLVVALLGTGVYLTLRLGFVQFRRFWHGILVTSGRYDDPDEPGDVSHFEALNTALSATVGIGNIAGVALAIHIGGPGAVFWMWVTALLGMATKYSEVSLAQHYRVSVKPEIGKRVWAGTVAGGPMYYIEKGLGKRWKPIAMFFAFMLMLTSLMTGNAVQANTVATELNNMFGIATWITGLLTASIVGVVIIGGIKRIGRVTSLLVPVMAAIYILAALVVLGLHLGDVGSSFARIVTEAFNPTAGVAGTGVGVFLTTMTYGVQRGLFSNEAGQGSAPIAHSAAKTDEPVSEGSVALLEPFIDTIVVCTMTALVIVVTGAYDARVDTTLDLNNPNIGYVEGSDAEGYASVDAPEALDFREGFPVDDSEVFLAYHDIAVPQLFTDPEQTQSFTGTLFPESEAAETEGGQRLEALYGDAVRTSSPLTSLGFQRGLEPIGLGDFGRYMVLISVFLFAISTSISWSYYGDRCANYLFGINAIVPYKAVFLIFHFIGAVLAVTTIWSIGDVALSLVTIPNVLALVLLSPVLAKITKSYFNRAPWLENEAVQKRLREEKKGKKGGSADAS